MNRRCRLRRRLPQVPHRGAAVHMLRQPGAESGFARPHDTVQHRGRAARRPRSCGAILQSCRRPTPWGIVAL